MAKNRSWQPLDTNVVRLRLVGTAEMIDDLLKDITTTRWMFGRIDTYRQRDGSTAIYAQLKRAKP
jgi:hypothetical protein